MKARVGILFGRVELILSSSAMMFMILVSIDRPDQNWCVSAGRDSSGSDGGSVADISYWNMLKELYI